MDTDSIISGRLECRSSLRLFYFSINLPVWSDAFQLQTDKNFSPQSIIKCAA